MAVKVDSKEKSVTLVRREIHFLYIIEKVCVCVGGGGGVKISYGWGIQRLSFLNS